LHGIEGLAEKFFQCRAALETVLKDGINQAMDRHDSKALKAACGLARKAHGFTGKKELLDSASTFMDLLVLDQSWKQYPRLR